MRAFPERIIAIQQQKNTTLALTLAPRVLQMPSPIQKYDDPFLPFGKAIIDATHDLVCAYLFDLASYLSLGAAGAIALERTIAYAKAGQDVLTILHGRFTTADYVEATGVAGFNVDAVTINQLDSDSDVLHAYSNALNQGVVFADGDSHSLTVFSAESPDYAGKIRIAGNEVLYASQREDFAEQARAALEALR